MNSQYAASYVDVAGNSYEQGVAIGKALREEIAENIRRVRGKMADAQVDEDRYQAFVQANAEFFQRERAEEYEELQGTAKGSGIPFEDILLLNIPAYFLADSFSKITSECSMICVRGKATADGCTYVIKNRDMGNPKLIQALIRRTWPDGRRIIEVSGAGTVTFPAVGINGDGLCVTTTGFWSSKDPTHTERVKEADIFLNVRVLLEKCRSVDEAVAFMKTAPRMNGLNVIVADRTKACVVEMTADDDYVEEDDGSGILYRTNHTISSKFRDLNEPVEKRMSSEMRYRRITELLQQYAGHIRFQDLLRIMSDHKYEPNCICRHAHDGVPANTVSTTICCVEDGEIWTSIGNMCLALPHAALEETE